MTTPHAELKNILDNTYNILMSNDQIEKNDVLKFLIKKIYSNFEALYTLIVQESYHEAEIIARSIIESFVCFIYFVHFPEKQKNYIQDSQLLNFKNNLINLIQFLECDKGLSQNIAKNDFNSSYEDLIKYLKKDIINVFHQKLSDHNQQLLLKKLNKEKFILEDEDINKLKRFFKSYRPIFMNLESMYSELKKQNVCIDNTLNIREIIFNEYNTFSQITHGDFFAWNRKVNLLKLYQIIFRINNVIIYISKNSFSCNFKDITPKLQPIMDIFTKNNS